MMMIMGLRDIGASLPPGFRFYPSDEELVCHYLYKKIANEQALKGTLVDVDLHTCEPWQLPEVAKLNATEWYFFSFRDRKYATGFRTNRATTSGYWKATGKDRTVQDPMSGEIVGMRKTLVFYKNRAPNGIKTGWIMHEFRLESPHMPPKEDWVLCRVFHKGKDTEDKSSDHGSQMLFDNSPITTHAPRLITHEHNNNNNNNNNNLKHFGPPASTDHQNQNQSSSLLNLLHLSHTDTDMIASKAQQLLDEDGDYGLLWDMNLEENNILLEDMSYDPINHSNMVFI